MLQARTLEDCRQEVGDAPRQERGHGEREKLGERLEAEEEKEGDREEDAHHERADHQADARHGRY